MTITKKKHSPAMRKCPICKKSQHRRRDKKLKEPHEAPTS